MNLQCILELQKKIVFQFLEKVSGLQFNKDFYAGYSPERINPGDKEHTVEKY